MFSPTLDLQSLDERATVVAKQEVAKKEAKQDTYTHFDDYIKTKERKVSKATLTVYGNVKAHLQAFEKYRREKISFASFDFNFYHDFIDYLTFEHVHMRRQEVLTGLKLNTIGKTIKHLRGYIKDRVKRKIIAPIDLYDVETRIFNQSVKRNGKSFPADFMFQLTRDEWESVRLQMESSQKSMSSQFVMTYPGRRPNSALPYTEAV